MFRAITNRKGIAAWLRKIAAVGFALASIDVREHPIIIASDLSRGRRLPPIVTSLAAAISIDPADRNPGLRQPAVPGFLLRCTTTALTENALLGIHNLHCDGERCCCNTAT